MLVAAAVLTGVTGVVLIGGGWLLRGLDPGGWERLVDLGWWVSWAMRVLGWAVLGKGGLKLAFIVVAAVVAGVAWWSKRRKVDIRTPEKD